MFPSNFVEDIGADEDTTASTTTSSAKETEANLENINNQLNVSGEGKGID